MATELQTISQLILFPVIVLGLWTLLFNNKNTKLSRFIVEGGYVFIAIPLLVLTFIMIPFSMVAFWMNTTDKSGQIIQFFIFLTIGIIIVVEYFYIKRIITDLEEKEQKPFVEIVKSWFDPEVRAAQKLRKDEKAEKSVDYFDEIERMNTDKRKLDLEKKEKLKRALLNEYE